MAWLLLLDTCGQGSGVGVAQVNDDHTRLISEQPLPERETQERLLPAIQEALHQAGITSRDLNAVAVLHGPGSFTGVRIGLAAAKGLVEALNLHLIAISRLEAIAFAAQQNTKTCAAETIRTNRAVANSGANTKQSAAAESTTANQPALSSDEGTKTNATENQPVPCSLFPVPSHSERAQKTTTILQTWLDAGRGDVFVGRYQNGTRLFEGMLSGPAAVAQAGEDPVVIIEPRLLDLLDRAVYQPSTGLRSWLPLAAKRLLAAHFNDPATTDANYLRIPDAELALRSRQNTTATSQPEQQTPGQPYPSQIQQKEEQPSA